MRESWKPESIARDLRGYNGTMLARTREAMPGDSREAGIDGGKGNHSGRNKRTVWTIPTQPYPDAHFATFPRKLVEPCILAGTSEKGCCPECGSQWERVIESEQVKLQATNNPGKQDKVTNWDRNAWPRTRKESKTIGWQPACSCGADPVPAVVCDIFGGSGTVALVAHTYGRRWVLIEKSKDYCDMAVKRIKQETRQRRMF